MTAKHPLTTKKTKPRRKLKEILDQRMRFSAVVGKRGTRTGFEGQPEETILFQNIRRVDTGEQATDHVWFAYLKTFETAGIRFGDLIEFDARVATYQKGYCGYRNNWAEKQTDYKLSRPTKVKVILRAEARLVQKLAIEAQPTA